MMKYIVAVLSILFLLAWSIENVSAQNKEGQSSVDGRIYFSDPTPTVTTSDKVNDKRIYFGDPSPQLILAEDVEGSVKKRIHFTDPSPRYILEEELPDANDSGRE